MSGHVPPVSHHVPAPHQDGRSSSTSGFGILTVAPVEWLHNISGPATVAAARGRGTRSQGDRDA